MINRFMTRHSPFLSLQSKRISDYFEMTCYNDVVKYYENNKYTVLPANLQSDGSFRYKLSSTGLTDNFSCFEVTKKYSKSGAKYEYEIHHNLAVESAFKTHMYYAPDICVIKKGGVTKRKKKGAFFNGKRAFCCAENPQLQTFFECKHLYPFPEVLFSFTGLVLELMPEIIDRKQSNHLPRHIAPAIILSGGGNLHTNKIQDSLTGRYNINVLFGLFYRTSQIYSAGVRTIGRR